MKRIVSLHVDAAARKRGADGSAAHPFPTLEAARDALRRRRAAGRIPRDAPVDVLVREGVYRLKRPLSFDARDGGTAAAPVTWRAADAGLPVITGGIDLTRGWEAAEPVGGLACWRRPMPEARGPDGVRFTQLFVGGARRYRARLPREGFWRFEGVPKAEEKRAEGNFFYGAMAALLPAEAARVLRDPAALHEAEFVVPDHWYENHLRAESLSGRTVRFETRGFSRLSKDETRRPARFRLDNVRAGLAEPGFWFLDRAAGELLYLPLPGEKMNETPVEAPVLPCLLRVAGDLFDPEKRVRHLRFEFLDLRAQEWELPRASPGVRQSAFQVPAAVHFEGAEDCALYACRVSRVAGWGVEMLRGCRRVRVVACSLRDLGAGGVKIGSEGPLPDVWFDELASRGVAPEALGWGPRASDPRSAPQRQGAPNPAPPCAATVADCSIRGGGRLFHSAIGVWCGDAGGCRIVHNDIADFFYSGISCGWSWGYMPAHTRDNLIVGNRVSDIGHGMLSDMGAVYTLGRQPGTVVARNFVHDVGSYGYGGWGLYADEGTSWARFEENVVLRTRCEGFNQHYGRDNLVRRNLLADSGETGACVGRTEAFRALVLERNVVLHPATAAFRGARQDGAPSADIRGNVYAPAPGETVWPTPPRGFALCEGGAAAPDVGGALPAPRLPRGRAGQGTLSAEEAARIVAESGPRHRGGRLPASIDDIPPEPATTCALLEPVLLAAPLAWRFADDPADEPDFWKAHDRAGIPCKPGTGIPVSMTLENRGFAPVAGRYRFRVEPAGAARLEGPKTLDFDLAPDGRAGWEARLVPTGNAPSFRLVATVSAPDQPGADLRFALAAES